MSLKVVHLASSIEQTDEFHMSRLLLLLKAASGKTNKPIQGIMKLAKMDFLLRYPNCLVRALEALGKGKIAEQIPASERDTIEARMIRFRFGPWDTRYRRWIALLVSKGLADTYLEARTVNVKLTDKGNEISGLLAATEDFKSINERSKIVAALVGRYSATALKDFVYKVFPEITNMQWGRHIQL